MSNRYPLRNRAVATAHTVTQGEQNSPSTSSSDFPGMDPLSVLGNVRAYSDVVASRPASVASRRNDSSGGESDSGSTVNPENFNRESSVVTVESKLTSLESSSSDDDEDERPWALVQPRRARSMEPLRGSKLSKSGDDNKILSKYSSIIYGNELTMEQDTVVTAAEKALTVDERERISKRYASMDSKVDESMRSDSKDEGPSKGKGVDPQNWGAAGIDSSELDVGAQRQAFEAWIAARPPTGQMNAGTPQSGIVGLSSAPADSVGQLKRNERPPHIDRNRYKATVEEVSDMDVLMPQASRTPFGLTPLSDTMAKRVADTVEGCRSKLPVRNRVGSEIKPISQVAPDSYLGKALLGLKSDSRGCDPPSSSGGSSSSRASSPSSSSLGLSDVHHGHSRRQKHGGHRHR
jgi:hypothetical protein